MSGIYWGIVAWLLAMVATLFVCVDIMYSKTKGSSNASSGRVEEPNEAVRQASAGSRQAA